MDNAILAELIWCGFALSLGLLALVELETSAVARLILRLLDALAAADLPGRIRSWWCILTHRRVTADE